jgi:hypothetical protein
VYGEGAINGGNVRKWCQFKEGNMVSAQNNKLLVGGIFCDLEKTFDYVNHTLLLLILWNYS